MSVQDDIDYFNKNLYKALGLSDTGEPMTKPISKLHFHHCPGCYQKLPCTMACTIEPDLEDDGKEFGAHIKCDECEGKAIAENTALLCWRKYTGIGVCSCGDCEETRLHHYNKNVFGYGRK